MQFTYAHECEIGDNVVIGPYVHLRPGSKIDNNVKINEKEFSQSNLKSFFDNKIIINQTDVLIKLLKKQVLTSM